MQGSAEESRKGGVGRRGEMREQGVGARGVKAIRFEPKNNRGQCAKAVTVGQSL